MKIKELDINDVFLTDTCRSFIFLGKYTPKEIKADKELKNRYKVKCLSSGEIFAFTDRVLIRKKK